jgi:hypothetical protein
MGEKNKFKEETKIDQYEEIKKINSSVMKE